MKNFNPEKIFSDHREHYIKILKPLFMPDDPIINEIVLYFSSILRVLGMEDKGWDPYAESRKMLNDINRLMKIKLPKDKFPDDWTAWRLGLILYGHIVEMDAPYEVITNLLRFRLGKGYSPNPYFDLLKTKEKSNFERNGIRTYRKIELIKALSKDAGLEIGQIYDDFYNARLRNAVQHSDFIFSDDYFRSRNGISGVNAFKLTYAELDSLIIRAKAFIAAYFQIEMDTRAVWGLRKGEAIPYDARYKGLIEILADDCDLLCGFAVYWPNGSRSLYRRTESGSEMVNCMVNVRDANLDLWVGLYAKNPGTFSPLVEVGAEPIYHPLNANQLRPSWPQP